MLIELDPPIDFRLAIVELQQQGGVSYRQQADRINVPWSTFQRWMQGSEPAHSAGQAFCKLYLVTLHRTPPSRGLTGRGGI